MLRATQSTRATPVARTAQSAQSLQAHKCKRTSSAACRATVTFTAQTTAQTDLAVEIYPNEDAVGKRMCDIVEAAAKSSLQSKGKFFLAVPGGSVLKMCGSLVGRQGIDWSNTYLAYVNHKCVPHDGKASTHWKALDIFINKVGLPLANVLTTSGGSDAAAEAEAYAAKLRGLVAEQGMDTTPQGVPRFDLMLIGMGADGHVGSLYPDRPEVNITDSGVLVLPVARKDPASITLTLPVMCAAKASVVAVTGASKAPTTRTALEDHGVAPEQLPGSAVRPLPGGHLTWLIDAPAAAQLQATHALAALSHK